MARAFCKYVQLNAVFKLTCFIFSVAQGSNVTFSFTFGDESPTYEIPGTLNALHRSVASVGHVFGAGKLLVLLKTNRAFARSPYKYLIW